jgi:hypothetical protein
MRKIFIPFGTTLYLAVCIILMHTVTVFAGWAGSWVPGHTHPKYPNVIATDQNGRYRPAAGYVWIYPDGPIGPVRWQPGAVHPDYDHVIAADREGYFVPETGYTWDRPGGLGPVHRLAEQESAVEVILELSSVIGTSQNVKNLNKAKAQGRHYHKDLTQMIVEERPVPQSCGVRTAQLFRERIVSQFGIPARDNCYISDKRVKCPTEYLPGYSKVYLTLNYTWQPDELDLTLTVQQQGFWGVKQKRLFPEHVRWLESLFDCLVSVAECNSYLPGCWRKDHQ